MEKIIPEFPNYKILDNGTVLSKKQGYRNYKNGPYIKQENWKPLLPVLDNKTGYYLVTLCKTETNGTKVRKNQFIHRLLAQAFIPNPESKAHVNHIDGIKTNNTLTNLEWATEQENSQHAVDLQLTTYTHCEKPVIQYAKDKITILNEYKSLAEANRSTGIEQMNISKVVRGIRPYAGGFHWKYKESVETNCQTTE